MTLGWGPHRFVLSAWGRMLWSGAALRHVGVAEPADGSEAVVLIVDKPEHNGFHEFPQLALSEIWAARVEVKVTAGGVRPQQ